MARSSKSKTSHYDEDELMKQFVRERQQSAFYIVFATVIAIVSILAALQSPNFAVQQLIIPQPSSSGFESVTDVNPTVVEDSAVVESVEPQIEVVEESIPIVEQVPVEVVEESVPIVDEVAIEVVPAVEHPTESSTSSSQILERIENGVSDMEPQKEWKQKSNGGQQWNGIIDWMESGGSIFKQVELVTYAGIDDHRGVHASSDIEANVRVMQIPKEYIISSTRYVLHVISHAHTPY